MYGDERSLDLLIQGGAQLDMTDAKRFHRAAWPRHNGDRETATYLVDAGSEVDAADAEGVALDFAAARDHRAITGDFVAQPGRCRSSTIIKAARP